MKRLLVFNATLWLLIIPSASYGQDSDKQVVESLKKYVQLHLASYEHNRRERVTKLGGGWVREYYQPDEFGEYRRSENLFIGESIYGNFGISVDQALHHVSQESH